MEIRPETLSPQAVHQLLISIVVPRPIAWVSTLSPEGRRNLAPFSFFMGVTARPPHVAFAIARRRGGEKKDTLRNIEATGECVVNIADAALAEAMNLTSAEAPPEVDEFELAGLTPVPSLLVRPPRVKEAPLAMECRAERIVEVGDPPCGLVIARVLLFHVRDDLYEEGRVVQQRWVAIGRLGEDLYCRVTDLFRLPRPPWPLPQG